MDATIVSNDFEAKDIVASGQWKDRYTQDTIDALRCEVCKLSVALDKIATVVDEVKVNAKYTENDLYLIVRDIAKIIEGRND